MAIFNEAYVELLLEKKTTEEYHISNFKKEFNFVPSKEDPNIGTITDDQGKKYKVKIDLRDTDELSADQWDKDSLIILNKRFFNLKGSNKNERMKALLQHEIGHQNLHNWNPDNKTVDKRNRSMESIKDDAIKTIKGIDGRDMSNASDKRIFKVADIDAKGYSKTLGSPEDQKRRNADLEKAKKYEKEGHTNAQEFEADRFAANKTSEEALKKGLRNLNKMNRKSYYKDYKEKHKNDDSNTDHEKGYKKFNSETKADYDQRSKALKDKGLRDAKTYK